VGSGRFPQWWILLGAFAKRHRQVLNELLGTEFGRTQSDLTFRRRLAELDVSGFDTLLRDWMAAKPVVAEELDTLVCVANAARLYR
jgi:hypothetical protein